MQIVRCLIGLFSISTIFYRNHQRRRRRQSAAMKTMTLSMMIRTQTSVKWSKPDMKGYRTGDTGEFQFKRFLWQANILCEMSEEEKIKKRGEQA